MSPRMICIGGSHGSIDVVHDLLAKLPGAARVPVVIVLHRHVSSQDALMRLLRSRGQPAIVEPFDKDEISDGAVYLAPPNYHMMVDDHAICLSTDPPRYFARPSIDVLFESVAHEYGPHCLGVILSGASSDGAWGASEIERCGGSVIVQDPATATAAAMPRAALKKVPLSRKLTVPQIAAFCRKFCLAKEFSHE